MSRVLIMVLVLGAAFGLSGLAEPASDGSVAWPTAAGDGSAPFPSSQESFEPSPQFCWTRCCSDTWEVAGSRRLVFEGHVCLSYWRCQRWPGREATFYRRLVEAQFCCYRGWHCFGFCITQDSTATCWWQLVENIQYFIGCGC